MTPVKQILDHKREGLELSSADIRDLILAYSRGEVPDYQMAAFAMAICCRGMSSRETADLTDAMMRSGESLDWGSLVTADKHSTGGVGDKVSLVTLPIAAACGLYVPSMMGRGLGHTGGTVDKLESIPGYNASLSLEALRNVVREAGLAMTCQTAEICPADRKLYALRDVTGTVASIPLITGSILSKKLAEGAGALVFDVKTGSGAFMQSLEDARDLARSLVDGAKAAGRKASALVTSMESPLGSSVGNANEVEESLDILSGKISPISEPLAELCIEEAALMVALANGVPRDEARSLCREKLFSGEAFSKFDAAVRAQGGSLEKFRSLRSSVRVQRFRISAMKSGFIAGIDALTVANVALMLGAGRYNAADTIDCHAGVDLLVKVGDKVPSGAPLATLVTASRPDDLEQAAAALIGAFKISPSSPPSKSLIVEEVL